MFNFKTHELTLNRVHDRVAIKEGDERLELRVDADPMRMVAGLTEAQRRLKTVTEDMGDEEKTGIAQYFAGVIFGTDQAAKLLDFYHGDAACVIMICGQYFSGRLANLIDKAQRKIK